MFRDKYEFSIGQIVHVGEEPCGEIGVIFQPQLRVQELRADTVVVVACLSTVVMQQPKLDEARQVALAQRASPYWRAAG